MLTENTLAEKDFAMSLVFWGLKGCVFVLSADQYFPMWYRRPHFFLISKERTHEEFNPVTLVASLFHLFDHSFLLEKYYLANFVNDNGVKLHPVK